MLPDVIEIQPLGAAPKAEITVPGSKSITNRALILAALARGEVTLRGALWSEDTQVMTNALQQLGFEIEVKRDSRESCNRTLHVKGLDGRISRAGSSDDPLELFVGNAGTAARFLAAFVCLGKGAYRLRGVKRMHERPQAALFHALRELGYRIDANRDRLPAVIHGSGPRATACRISIDESSQFASGLLLCAGAGSWTVQLADGAVEEAAYVAMTRQLIGSFPHGGGEFQIEADASSASYFVAADWLFDRLPGTGVKIAAYPQSSWQIDAAFPKFLPLPARVSRATDLGDSIMTAMVLAPFADQAIMFTELGRLRVQECERVAALRAELTKCGAKVLERGQSLTIYPAGESLHGATIETYQDHRMAMCFAILGLKIPGIKIKNPACVRKTFPNFFQKLAAPPPVGLGAVLFDPQSGVPLEGEHLFAG